MDARFRSLRWRRQVARRVVAAWVAVVMVAGIGVLGTRSLATSESADVIVAAELFRSAGVPGPPDTVATARNMLGEIGFITGFDPGPVDPAGALPVPERPASWAYAPTPEVRHGVLEIPAIGLSQPFFEGVTLTAINRGPSHWPGTAMPGETGNVVIAGHRTTYSRPFWDLDLLEPGDRLLFRMNDGTVHVYRLESLEIVYPTDIHIIEQTYERRATLFACHPKGSARQRIVGHFVYEPGAVIVDERPSWSRADRSEPAAA